MADALELEPDDLDERRRGVNHAETAGRTHSCCGNIKADDIWKPSANGSTTSPPTCFLSTAYWPPADHGGYGGVSAAACFRAATTPLISSLQTGKADAISGQLDMFTGGLAAALRQAGHGDRPGVGKPGPGPWHGRRCCFWKSTLFSCTLGLERLELEVRMDNARRAHAATSVPVSVLEGVKRHAFFANGALLRCGDS